MPSHWGLRIQCKNLREHKHLVHVINLHLSVTINRDEWEVPKMLLACIFILKNYVCMYMHACLCMCAHIHTSGDQRTVLWSFVSVCVVLSTHVCGIVPGIELRLSGLPSKRLHVLNHLTGPSTTSLNPILFLWLSLFRAASQFWLFNPSTCFTGTAFCPSTFRCPAVIIVLLFFLLSSKEPIPASP